jgi:hypothetical protein
MVELLISLITHTSCGGGAARRVSESLQGTHEVPFMLADFKKATVISLLQSVALKLKMLQPDIYFHRNTDCPCMVVKGIERFRPSST